MRIHTDTLTLDDMYRAANRAERAGHGSVYLDSVSEHGSRSRHHAFAVTLTGDGSVVRRRVNYGTARNRDRFSRPFSATYDSWGWFIAYLFTVDPAAIVGPYNGVDDFRRQTTYAYVGDPSSAI